MIDHRVQDLMTLQGNIRVLLIQHGIEDEKSGVIAGEILHNLMKGNIAKEKYTEFYQELQQIERTKS